ncbi:MAG: NAD(P)/FAD-dependent oxidoreductase [Deltaproteobacteria bacterium]|nr:NAD(P)/FAD-dependent oxidoreductase [Deltaproteobacteria bacterium]
MADIFSHPDVIIIGAGASGLMCAIEAGNRGRRVLCLDHGNTIAKKVLVSGGGNCNFTNREISPDHYESQNRHFCKSALARYGQYNFLSLLDKHGISYHEKDSGRLFCNHSSKAIVKMLLDECRKAGVVIRTECAIQKIWKDKAFYIETGCGDFLSESLVVATGGLSYPGMGATGLGYRIAEQFGLAVVKPRPALVPLLFNDEDAKHFQGLQGITLDVEVRCRKKRFRDSLLFTHQGLSGPAILRISSFRYPNDPLTIDLLPDFNLAAYLKQQKSLRPESQIKTLLAGRLPGRLAQRLCDLRVRKGPLGEIPDKELQKIDRLFHHWEWVPAGTAGYNRAEVTLGGVDTEALSSKTMEAKEVKGLYFVGEVVDITGDLGGYNLQWAWSSGYCAGQYV